MTTTFPRTMGYGLGGSLQRGTSAFGPWVTSDPYDYPLRDQTMTSAPSFPPFKFESRRARIDWRLLHGIDINAMMRDVDLDTLEKIVNIVAFGDIEAEDTRHLTELNFIKIFRLSQMMIEYLLYVQDCLQNSNAWLQQDRSNMDKYVQAARLRIRELDANLKMSKRELRRSRKTIKTYELLAVLNDGKGAAATTAAAAVSPPAPPPPQPQVVRVEPNPVNLAMEALLRKELAALGDRLGKATLECQTLRSERDELYQVCAAEGAVKDLEATVKARTHTSGTSSPHAYSRQNAEALQAVQGFQDQLNKATVEITKLRNEKEDLTAELEQANVERRQLQDEKSRLLSELASRPAGPTESPRASENLSSMLLEADRQKAALQEQLSDAKAEIAALQKQLMKAMKATALGALPSSQQSGDERMLRELESAKAQLDRELADLRRTYSEDVRQLQEELEAAQERVAAAERRLAEVRAAQRDGSGRMSPPQTGGFVKIVEERRSQPEDAEDYNVDRQRALLAEYEATNERLNQQLIQLKGERNALAGEVEQLRLQLQNRTSPPPGDRSIGRDWRTEEMERLKEERDASQRRVLDLEDALRDRDALIERLRTTVRDLQAQLEAERKRQQASSPDSGPSHVRKQVKHFERLADPAKVQSSFSFPGDSPPGGGSSVETPTSLRKPAASDLPPHSPKSPTRSPTILEESEVTSSSAFLPPSPQQQRQQHDPSQGIRWLRRIPRPNQTQAAAIQQQVMRHVAGMLPEGIDRMIQDEIRVISENPYEFEGDDEERFRAMLTYEMAERKGVLSISRHNLEDLATARSLFTDLLLARLDDELAQYSVDTTTQSLSDKTYLACMQELSSRRRQLLEKFPRDVQDRAEDLRNFLMTHLELLKRDDEAQRRLQQQAQLQQQMQQQKLEQQKMQQQQPSQASDMLGAGHEGEEEEIQPGARVVAVPAADVGGAAGQLAQVTSGEPGRSVSLASRSQGLAAAAEAAAAPLATGAVVAASPAPRQLPSFPSRQNSQRSSATGGDATAVEELRGSLALELLSSFQNHDGAYLDRAPTPVMLTREVSPGSPERITLGHAKPMQVVARSGLGGGAAAAAAAVATASPPSGNMNMSIRSVKYQDSDFDDDEEDVTPLPQPKAVRRVADDDDEYTLTEDEETQQDMGIEESVDFSTGARQPMILRAPAGSPQQRTLGPSRLGAPPKPAQTRGWATDEPLQAAPAKAKASPQPSEAAEVEMLDSIQSFDNTNSQSLKRSPGAWGSPSATLRKPTMQSGKVPSTQVSVASRQSGWNEAISSFTAGSGTADEVQAIQDITESTEYNRPMGRVMNQRGPTGASQDYSTAWKHFKRPI
ncbi:hypothetical protein VOLCADRAFT_88956 [Volvox carteri f. nagariensis]|uniref:Cilium assembly protein DZIP1 N-terminal domain-containing protein n=1 Tax=Volvox carteri f. nagariensis TaxID=3068 RepID=D8TQE8_VOLCA|nr:uncharacterized protein VOLCADRAFT_88956 [Volvox carteri f. nagariensis]EFJ50393.1 hypothetical protein VOLCADRAFT_88956 [Volvox carteri f. nagariensis]|eukprot:XP_002948518.1 hypothetical protein VOLCADRAFT_88956 [Volvox carteri f. nagariensis]